MKIPKKSKNPRLHWVWFSPALGQIKVDIDGSFVRWLGARGIVSVLRDPNDRLLI